jgi:hypothetical protein
MAEDRKMTEADLDEMVENPVPEETEEYDDSADYKAFMEAMGLNEEEPAEPETEPVEPEAPVEEPVPEAAETPPEEAPPEEAEQPPEQPLEEVPAEEQPDLDQTEEVETAQEEEQTQDYLQNIAEAVMNELQTQQGVEISPEVVQQIISMTAETMSNDFNTQLEAIKQSLTENEEAFSLLNELNEVKGEADYADHEKDIMEALAKQEKVKPGDYKRLLTEIRASKYKPSKAVLDEALKDQKMLDELAKNPELKKRIAEAMKAEQYEKNKDVPPVSPQNGGAYQQEPKKPTTWDEAGDMMFAYADRKAKRT